MNAFTARQCLQGTATNTARLVGWLTICLLAFLLCACGGGGGTSDPGPAAPTAPVITAQPSNQAVTAPATASFVVAATGNPSPTYQWQLSTDGGATFANINGATSATYTTPATTGADSGKQFRAVVTNGTGSVTSSAGTLTVTVPGGTLSAFVGLASPNPETPVDGTGSAALFAGLLQISRGSDGKLYAVDDQMIRQITPAGVVTTIAGSFGNRGTTDGAGATALFNAPFSVVSDASGNLYVSDTFNNTIRKISPAHVVSTFAGAPGAGSPYADGTGTAARFRAPKGLAVDSAGNVYVADQGNYVIRKITPAGVVSTFVGTAGVAGSADGTGPAASFTGVESLAFDPSGNLFASDFARSTIRKITPAGVVTTFAGADGQPGYANGVGSAARFFAPHGLAVDVAGDVYVTDSLNDTIRKITPTGSVTTVVGVKGSQTFTPGPLPASVNAPFGLAFIGSILYVTNGGQVIAAIANVP